MSKAIAFFDFDGTITTKDTLLEFIKFCKGSQKFLAGFVWNSPYLVAYKLKIISNQKAKEKVLAHFFRNMPVAEFDRYCTRFASEVIPGLLRPQALKEIEKLKQEGATVVIVSASPENWISKWSQALQLELIATNLEIRSGKITGKLVGINCHGQEKVKRITERYKLADYTTIYAYGDSSGDKPMLSLANHPHMKPFRS